MPGMVDAHVHLNEPGRTEWEGFESGSRAAVSGGVTTVVDMPLNAIPPTTTVDNLDVKRLASMGKCYSDVAFWGGVVPSNVRHLLPLVDAGVRGFKGFLIDSGVEEFPHLSPADVETAMDTLKDSGSILMFHAEMESGGRFDTTPDVADGGYQHFLDSRPDSFEVDAITKIVSIAKKFPQLRIHIVHLASAKAIPILRTAIEEGVKITIETCFHYLTFEASEIPDRATQYKCCPPIRSASNREALWDAVKDGLITSVVSDHSPCVPKLKQGSFMNAWGGVSALGLGLQILWTEGRPRGLTIQDISRLTSTSTAQQASLYPRKGALLPGSDADLVIWDQEVEWTVDIQSLHFKNKVSPYIGKRMRGQVVETWLRGQKVWDRQRQWVTGARGKLLP